MALYIQQVSLALKKTKSYIEYMEYLLRFSLQTIDMNFEEISAL